MKRPFALSSILLTASYPAALAAEALGVVSSGVASFLAFVGCCVASSVLAFAFRDNSRPSNDLARRERKPMAHPAAPVPSTATRDTAWVHRTISA